MASTSGSSTRSWYEPWWRGMPSCAAVAAARAPSREAIAVTVQRSDCCIAGMTLFTAIEAQPRTPQRTRSLTTTSPAFPRWQRHAPLARWRLSWTPHSNGRGAPAVEVASYAPAMRIDLATIVVDDYDGAVEFFVGALGFELVEDSAALTNDGRAKRWVVVRPPGAETGILLARADGASQAAIVGHQVAGRVGFFLRVD